VKALQTTLQLGLWTAAGDVNTRFIQQLKENVQGPFKDFKTPQLCFPRTKTIVSMKCKRSKEYY